MNARSRRARGKSAGVTAWEGPLETASAVVLLFGLAVAAYSDLRIREISDRLWQLVAIVGTVVGAVLLASGGAVPVLAWLLVAGLLLQYLFPWDERLPDRWRDHASAIELSLYVLVIAPLLWATFAIGVGPTAIPLAVVATLVTIVFARVLHWLGIFYGFADAKALMVIGLLVPTFAHPWLGTAYAAGEVLVWMPFAITALTDAALVSVVLPLYLAARNATRGEFRWDRAFTCYMLPTTELPRSFVWVKEPELPAELQEAIEDAETSEEDAEIRGRAAEGFLAQGITRVWVSPQVPYVVLLALGTLAGLLAGNLVLDLRSVL
jgi:hypothetical protein